MKNKKYLKEKLILNYLTVSNKTVSTSEFDIPSIKCNTTVYPDFLALDSEPGLFYKTPYTGVCFFRYDYKFNGINGLFNAIYYNDIERQSYYLNKFKNVKFIIEMDISQCGDIHRIENLYRLFQRRIVSIWFVTNLHTIVIPLISYSNENSFSDMIIGLHNCSVVAFGIKGNMNNPMEKELLQKAIKYAVDHLNLDAIVVYSVCYDDSNVYKIFQYAINHNIKIIIPENTLRTQNMLKKESYGKI